MDILICLRITHAKGSNLLQPKGGTMGNQIYEQSINQEYTRKKAELVVTNPWLAKVCLFLYMKVPENKNNSERETKPVELQWLEHLWNQENMFWDRGSSS